MFAYAGKIKPGIESLGIDGDKTTVTAIDFYGGDKGYLPADGYVCIRFADGDEIETEETDIIYATEHMRAWTQIEFASIENGDHIIFVDKMKIEYGKVEKIFHLKDMAVVWISGYEEPMMLRLNKEAYITTALHLLRHVDLLVE